MHSKNAESLNTWSKYEAIYYSVWVDEGHAWEYMQHNHHQKSNKPPEVATAVSILLSQGVYTNYWLSVYSSTVKQKDRYREFAVCSRKGQFSPVLIRRTVASTRVPSTTARASEIIHAVGKTQSLHGVWNLAWFNKCYILLPGS